MHPAQHRFARLGGVHNKTTIVASGVYKANCLSVLMLWKKLLVKITILKL